MKTKLFVVMGLVVVALAVSTGVVSARVGSPSVGAAARVMSWRYQASRSGSLYDGRAESRTFTLSRDTTYRFDGSCDSDCSDLDFELFDENNQLVAYDRDDDDVPRVEITPIRSATFRLRVIMASCDVSPCRYSVNQYTER